MNEYWLFYKVLKYFTSNETCKSLWKFLFYFKDSSKSVLLAEDNCTEWCIGFRRFIKINNTKCPWCSFIGENPKAFLNQIATQTGKVNNSHNNILLGIEKPLVSKTFLHFLGSKTIWSFLFYLWGLNQAGKKWPFPIIKFHSNY